MARTGKCFTITWRIENYNFGPSTIQSPSFIVDSNYNSPWYFEIARQSALRKDHVTFQAKRKVGDRFGADIFASFFINDSSTPLFEGFFGTNPCMTFSSACYVPHNQVYERKKDGFHSPQTLTVRCCMYKTGGSFSVAGQCSARTRIRMQRTGFVTYLTNFSFISPGVKRHLRNKSTSTEEEELFYVELSTGDLCCSEKLYFEVFCNKDDEETENYIKRCKSKLFLIDSDGRKTECGRHEYDYQSGDEWVFDLYFTKGYLMRRKSQFLSNNILKIKCEFAYSTGIEFSEIEDSEFVSLAKIDEKQLHISGALEDVTRLYKESILCDIELRVETEAFKAHKSILSARSSVFRSMFETEMKEKISDCVIIKDMDASTVHRMLSYVYSDKLEDMDWDSAQHLYFAADKYDLLGLKHGCSDFLKNNLNTLNCSELLLLAEMHQDGDLKQAVQEYIADHREEIFRSDQWTIFEKSNPKLAIETFHAVYLEEKKNLSRMCVKHCDDN